jgi:flagellar motor switch protein FliN/FliY
MSETATAAIAGSIGGAPPRDAARANGAGALSLDAVMRIPVTMQVILGSATMPVGSLMKLSRGAVVPLDRRIGDPVDIVVNGRVVARGEVVMEDDKTRFGISLTEIVALASEN